MLILVKLLRFILIYYSGKARFEESVTIKLKGMNLHAHLYEIQGVGTMFNEKSYIFLITQWQKLHVVSHQHLSRCCLRQP